MNVPTRLACIGLVLVTACGGGGSDDAGGPRTAILPSLAAFDGYVKVHELLSLTPVVTAADLLTGSLGGCRLVTPPECAASRAFVGFELPPLPAGAVVQSALLRVYQEGTSGTPYLDHGVLHVDHVDLGAALDEDDYDDLGLTLDLGTLATTPIPEWKTLDVTAAVAADLLAARVRSDFRLRFLTGSTGAEHVARFTASEDLSGTGNPPELVVTYTVP